MMTPHADWNRGSPDAQDHSTPVLKDSSTSKRYRNVVDQEMEAPEAKRRGKASPFAFDNAPTAGIPMPVDDNNVRGLAV